MWTHFCRCENCWISVASGQRCNWCDQGEPRAAPQRGSGHLFPELIERLRQPQHEQRKH